MRNKSQLFSFSLCRKKMETELQNQKLKLSEVFLHLQAVFVWHHQVNLPTKVSTATKQLHDEGENE